jgi:hypothetical protein
MVLNVLAIGLAAQVIEHALYGLLDFFLDELLVEIFVHDLSPVEVVGAS